MLRCCAAIVAGFLTFFSATAAEAQDVTLTSRDGSVEIAGTLIGYDGEFYRVDTVYGVLTVDGSGVLCAGTGCPDLTNFIAEIRLSGSQAMAEVLMPKLVGEFALQQGYVIQRKETSNRYHFIELSELGEDRATAKFVLHATTSDEGIADLLAETADIALSIREVQKQEVARGIEAGLGELNSLHQSRVIALDAIVPIVSPKNPIESLSLEEISQILSGSISNWQDLGGLDAPIELHLGQTQSGVTQAFLQKMSLLDADLPGVYKRETNDADVIEAVSRNPFAIGISLMSSSGPVRVIDLQGNCGFTSVATIDSVKTEDYPLTAPLFVYVPARRLPKVAREFLRFVRSPDAQNAIRETGFADQAISETTLQNQGNRLSNAIQNAGEEVPLSEVQRLVASLSGRQRLSTSFRFDEGSSSLDAQSRSNVVLLARALESGQFDGQELMFVGFSDGAGDAAANKRLSMQRASAVRAAVIKEAVTVDADRMDVTVEAFGEAMPMACDDTEWGRKVNRRVEIWAN